MATVVNLLRADPADDGETLGDLLDACGQTFRHSLAGVREKRAGRPVAPEDLPFYELPLYLALFRLQKSLLNWGAGRLSSDRDIESHVLAGQLASRVAFLKQAAIAPPHLPPNGMRDYWDRLLSLAFGDPKCALAQVIRRNDDSRDLRGFAGRLNRLLDVMQLGDPAGRDDIQDDWDRLEPIEGGALQAMAGIVCYDPDMVLAGLKRMTDLRKTSRSLGWFNHRVHLCPAAFGIARLAHDVLGLDFAPDRHTRWWDTDVARRLAQGTPAPLAMLDRVHPGLAELARTFPPRLGQSDLT